MHNYFIIHDVFLKKCFQITKLIIIGVSVLDFANENQVAEHVYSVH